MWEEMTEERQKQHCYLTLSTGLQLQGFQTFLHIADRFSSAAPRFLRSTLIITSTAPWQTAFCFTPFGEKEFNFYDISSRGTFLHGDNNISQQLSDEHCYNTKLSTVLKGKLCQLRMPALCSRLLEAMPGLSTSFKSPECLEKSWQLHFRFLKLTHQEKQCSFLSSIIPKTFERLTLLPVPQNSFRLLHSLSTQCHFCHSP